MSKKLRPFFCFINKSSLKLNELWVWFLQAFIRAWRAACDWRGKSRLLIPRGTFLIGPTIFQGPCQGPAPKIVQIVGTLKAVSDLTDYEEDFWILFENINGLIVTGTGTVDGQGANVWKYNAGGSSIFPVVSNKINITWYILIIISSHCKHLKIWFEIYNVCVFFFSLTI